MDNGIVSLWSLPENKIYLDLEKEFKEKIFNSAKEYAGTWDKLGKELNLIVNKYGSCKIIESARRKRFSLSLLNKIINYLNSKGATIDKRCVEKKISVISSKRGGSNKLANSIFNPKLPFNFNTVDGSIVISAIFHDGGIDSRRLPHYSNPENLELRQKVYKAFTNVFGEFVSKKSNPIENQQLYFPKIVGIILTYGLGIPCGRRVINNPSIPEFIFNSSDDIKSAFIQQAFDDESHVHRTERNISLKLSSGSKNPSNLIIGIKGLLENLGIETSGPHYIDYDETKKSVRVYRWYILITHQDNLKMFYEKVGFHSAYKQKRLQEIVQTIRYHHYSTKKTHEIYQIACRNLQKRYEFITSRKLAIELVRSQELAKKIIQKLVNNKVLLVKECRHGNRGAKYILSDKHESVCIV